MRNDSFTNLNLSKEEQSLINDEEFQTITSCSALLRIKLNNQQPHLNDMPIDKLLLSDGNQNEVYD